MNNEARKVRDHHSYDPEVRFGIMKNLSGPRLKAEFLYKHYHKLTEEERIMLMEPNIVAVTLVQSMPLSLMKRVINMSREELEDFVANKDNFSQYYDEDEGDNAPEDDADDPEKEDGSHSRDFDHILDYIFIPRFPGVNNWFIPSMEKVRKKGKTTKRPKKEK